MRLRPTAEYAETFDLMCAASFSTKIFLPKHPEADSWAAPLILPNAIPENGSLAEGCAKISAADRELISLIQGGLVAVWL